MTKAKSGSKKIDGSPPKSIRKTKKCIEALLYIACARHG
jgi:hypothetical protein